jgi:hypothetical protein
VVAVRRCSYMIGYTFGQEGSLLQNKIPRPHGRGIIAMMLRDRTGSISDKARLTVILSVVRLRGTSGKRSRKIAFDVSAFTKEISRPAILRLHSLKLVWPLRMTGLIRLPGKHGCGMPLKGAVCSGLFFAQQSRPGRSGYASWNRAQKYRHKERG